MRMLWASVVLVALDDAIASQRAYQDGEDIISRWAHSTDGQEVLSNAGINPSERVVDGLKQFVSCGVRTSVALAELNRPEK